MSSPTDPQPPAEPATPAQPTTQEIPVVTPAAHAQPLPPHPGASTPAPVRSVQATGPVGIVPGLPGQLPPPPAAPAAPSADTTSVWPGSLEAGPVPFVSGAPEESQTPVVRDRATLMGLGLVAASLVLLELGLGLRFGGRSFWAELPLWSAFATVCAVLGLAAFAALLPGTGRLSSTSAWRIAVGGLIGLAVFWLLVVLPLVAGDRGFLLTAAPACLGAALWIGPARRS